MSESTSNSMKQEIQGDFNAVLAKAEQFLKSVSREGETRSGALRSQLGRNWVLAKDGLHDAEDAVIVRTREGAHAANVFVHENPWTALGAGAGVGVVLGVLVGVLLSNR